MDNCHHQASCRYQSGQSGRASCVCDAGYTGDGINNCDVIVSTSSYTSKLIKCMMFITGHVSNLVDLPSILAFPLGQNEYGIVDV